MARFRVPKMYGPHTSDVQLTCECGVSKWYNPKVADKIKKPYRCIACAQVEKGLPRGKVPYAGHPRFERKL